jgi:hypothetical protein
MAATQRYKVDAMQLRVGSLWTDTEGREFVIDALGENGAETWVAYTRMGDRTSYRCLAEAFTYRFTEKIQ